MRRRILASFSLILAISLVVTFFAADTFAATEFKVKEANTSRPMTGKTYADDEIIVKFREGIDASSANRPFLAQGAVVLSTSPRGGFKRVRIPESRSVEEMLELYRNDPSVEYAEPNYVYHALMTPNDPYYSYQWHFPSISTESAWDESTGNGILVGIIDTGVAYEDYGSYQQAPDLANTDFVAGYDFVNNDSHANDDNAHGTHVCGTVAQSTNNDLGVAGIAYNCTIMPIKVLNSAGSGYISDIADGIYYAADNGCQVINMSLGGSSGSTTLHDAVQYAHNQGVTIVCAAGNSGSSSPHYPAAYSECISVSAVRYDDNITDYSNYGSTIDICAPGGDVDVDQNGDGYGDGVLQQTFASGAPTDFGYYFYEGTSMASPHVAGVAAMVIAAGGGSMSPSEVRNVLEGTATDLGASGWDQYYGHGKVNAYEAVLEAQGGGNPPVADFSGSPTSGDAPLTVNFTDESTNNPTSWSWDFGDGGTSTAQNPSHEYTSAGTYTVSLTATNADGSDTETKTDYITVTEPGEAPVAEFSGSPTSGDAPLTVNFTDESTNDPTSWRWDFGDGNTSSEQNPTHEYTSAGTYTVSLTVKNSYGKDTETKTDYITVTEPGQAPVAEFSGSPTSGDAPLTVNFTDESTNNPTSWSWDFGDGGTSTAQNPSHEYTSAGTYTVSLTATNEYGSDTETKTDYITVTEPGEAPVAEFSGSPTSGDAPLTVNFTDESTNNPTSWSWDFGDGGTSTAQNPSYEYTAAGTYTVSLTASNAYGSDTETKTDYITVTEPQQDAMHVKSIYVSRESWWFFRRGVATVTIVDQNNDPVSDATVYGDFTGPTSGSSSGTTNSKGQVTLRSSWAWGTSTEWCFEVTNVTKSGWTYDSGANEVTKACESGDVYQVTREEMMGSGGVPQVTELFQNYPNPFNPVTRIGFALSRESYVRLNIYNVKGELVETMVNTTLSAGMHGYEWNATNVSSGVYFYRLQTEEFTQTKKMLLLR